MAPFSHDYSSPPVLLDPNDLNRRCSRCEREGHSSKTCPQRGVMLFGVRLTDKVIRKSVSMGNLAQYPNSQAQSSSPEHSESGGAAPGGYVSDGLDQTSSSLRERKKGVPWTEEEHRLFLIGLQKLGKGDWRGISRNYVTSRTPTQVASHAQKYFLRQSNSNKRKRRSSLFDIPADAVTGSVVESHKSTELGASPPELSLGRSPSSHNRIPKYEFSVGSFPLPPVGPVSLPADTYFGRTKLSTDHEIDPGWNAYGENEMRSPCLQQSAPVTCCSSTTRRLAEAPTLPRGLSFWPGVGSATARANMASSTQFFGSPRLSCLPFSRTLYRASDDDASRSTETIVPTLGRIDEAVEFSSLSLSIGPPAMDISPPSSNLDQSARHSAFRSGSPSNGSSVTSNGAFSSAIRVV